MMKPTETAAIALGVIVIVEVIAGLLTVGGPLTGRAERRDDQRRDDIRDISENIRCLTRVAGGTIPDQPRITDRCPEVFPASDPFSGEPYEYEKLSMIAYRICATFETATIDQWYNYQSAGEGRHCLHVEID